jgi:glutathione S-transferase
MTQLILHHYDASPFSQKAMKMLAIKGLEWRSVLTPFIAPKPDLTCLTGGYRGTPVLQIGADIYVDNARIAAELDYQFEAPSLYPFGHGGLPDMLNVWGDAFFEAGLHLAINDLSKHWDPAFAKDREAVFARLDFASVKQRRGQAAASLRAHAVMIEAQLLDGRPFLLGDAPSLADIHAWPVLWFCRPLMPDTNKLLDSFKLLPPWEARVAALGEGQRSEISADVAHAEARMFEPVEGEGLDPDDPLELEQGQPVVVRATTSDRGESLGTLETLLCDEIVIAHENATVGKVHVHFPRIGYEVSPA